MKEFQKILPILRKIVTTKEGTASLANVDGFEIKKKQEQLKRVQLVVKKKLTLCISISNLKAKVCF